MTPHYPKGIHKKQHPNIPNATTLSPDIMLHTIRGDKDTTPGMHGVKTHDISSPSQGKELGGKKTDR